MKWYLFAVAALLLCFFTGQDARAQITIFNVPSSDVTPKGFLYQENEAQFRPYNPDPFYLGTHYSAVGVGYCTEIDVTTLNISAPYNGLTSLGVGFKSVIPLFPNKKLFKDRELKFVVGDLVCTGLGNGAGAGNWFYALGGAKLPGTNTRVTGGITTGTKQVFGSNVTCFTGGIEQSITKKLSLQLDWYSGKNNGLGFLIPGFCYVLPQDILFFGGYQIPNHRTNGRSGFVVEIGKFFNLANLRPSVRRGDPRPQSTSSEPPDPFAIADSLKKSESQ